MQRTDYDEFGYIISETLAENWTPVLFGYAGGLQDRDTGLIRFGARDYDPMVGRWTSKEPLGFNGSDNFYVYAENDPVNFVDPDGNFAWIAAGALGGAVINVGIDIISKHMSGKEITASSLIASAVSGAISGGMGTIAGPLGGTLSKALTGRASTLLARGLNVMISAAGAQTGEIVASYIDPCEHQYTNSDAFWGGVGGLVASTVKINHFATLKQVQTSAVFGSAKNIFSSQRMHQVLKGSVVSSSVAFANNVPGGEW